MFEFLAEDITSDYRFLLQLVNTFTIDTEKYYAVCYKVNDIKTFKNIVPMLTYTYASYSSCIL